MIVCFLRSIHHKWFHIVLSSSGNVLEVVVLLPLLWLEQGYYYYYYMNINESVYLWWWTRPQPGLSCRSPGRQGSNLLRYSISGGYSPGLRVLLHCESIITCSLFSLPDSSFITVNMLHQSFLWSLSLKRWWAPSWPGTAGPDPLSPGRLTFHSVGGPSMSLALVPVCCKARWRHSVPKSKSNSLHWGDRRHMLGCYWQMWVPVMPCYLNPCEQWPGRMTLPSRKVTGSNPKVCRPHAGISEYYLLWNHMHMDD